MQQKVRPEKSVTPPYNNRIRSKKTLNDTHIHPHTSTHTHTRLLSQEMQFWINNEVSIISIDLTTNKEET